MSGAITFFVSSAQAIVIVSERPTGFVTACKLTGSADAPSPA
jgi:hypothetical protein